MEGRRSWWRHRYTGGPDQPVGSAAGRARSDGGATHLGVAETTTTIGAIGFGGTHGRRHRHGEARINLWYSRADREVERARVLPETFVELEYATGS